jgi:hypothetical protein
VRLHRVEHDDREAIAEALAERRDVGLAPARDVAVSEQVTSSSGRSRRTAARSAALPCGSTSDSGGKAAPGCTPRSVNSLRAASKVSRPVGAAVAGPAAAAGAVVPPVACASGAASDGVQAANRSSAIRPSTRTPGAPDEAGPMSAGPVSDMPPS